MRAERLVPKRLKHHTLRLVTPKPSQLTIAWKVTYADYRNVAFVNIVTGREHLESWHNVRTWLREGLVQDVA